MPKTSRKQTRDALTSVELFTGAGGLALGIAKAGFEHRALVEWDKDACNTLRANKKRLRRMRDWEIFETDIRDFDFSPYSDEVTLLAGGAPCQPFSLGGKHKGDADHRNMFPEVFRALREIRPKAFLLENVKGLTRPTFRPYFDYIMLQLASPHVVPKRGEEWSDHKDRLERGGKRGEVTYNVTYQLVNCADYGIPQRRHRVFIVGFRSDLALEWKPLRPTHSEAALLQSQWLTRKYWEVHKIDPPVNAGPPSRNGWHGQLLQDKRWHTVRDALSGLPEPLPMKDHPDVRNHFLNMGARPYNGHTGSPMDLPAKALKAGDHGVPGGENTLQQPDGSVRYFTVREAARLQTFPDNYEFSGSWTESFRQLGNSVPVDMASRFASGIANILQGAPD